MLTRGMRAGVPASRLLYNIVIDIYGKSRQIDAAEQAEAVLMRMKAEERLKPDIVSYNAAIAAWGRSSHVEAEERSRALLQQVLLTLTPSVTQIFPFNTHHSSTQYPSQYLLPHITPLPPSYPPPFLIPPPSLTSHHITSHRP